ncbi:MAG TPA: hypothetical protein VJN18_07855 [Polyangiaceae bacterium]|nr:hypothetical protein [Polyangiaceae bacterium]
MSGIGGAAGSGGEPGAGAESGAGAAGAPPTNCAYPARLVEALPADRDVTDYMLSSAFPVDVSQQAWAGFHAAYDVNGDFVDDIVYTDLGSAGAQLRLLVSLPPPRSLEHAPEPCADLEALPVGRVFLRDVDGDRAPDFVIATDDRLHVFANRPEGFVSRLDYAWPEPNLKTSVLDVRLADITDDHRQSLVIGYDRVLSEVGIEIELGAMSFLSSFATPDFIPWKDVHTPLTEGNELPILTGYLTTGEFGVLTAGEVALLGLARDTSGSIARAAQFYEDVVTLDLRVPGFTDEVVRLFRARSANSLRLWVLGRQTLYEVEVATDPPQILASHPTVFQAQLSHELGGGPARPRAFVFDFDRDNDDDFIEVSIDGGSFALHVALEPYTFAPPQVFEARLLGSSELPFLTVGPVRAILEQPLGADTPAVIRTLFSGKYQAP